MPKNDGLTKLEISSIGMYEAFIELIWHGFKPKKADHERRAVLFATDPVTGKTIKLFVKATIKDCTWDKRLQGKVLVWPMTKDNKTLKEPDVFYCFVHIDIPTHQVLFYIMSSVFVVDNLRKQYDRWLKAVNRPTTEYEDFPAKFCIGVDAAATYSQPIPMEAEYKDRWDLLTY